MILILISLTIWLLTLPLPSVMPIPFYETGDVHRQSPIRHIAGVPVVSELSP